MYNRLFAYNERRLVWKYGDYIRTNNGVIRKIKLIRKDKVDVDKVYRRYGYLTETVWNYNIVKYSKNIIDLIQCGDYVNGHLVFDKAPNCVYIEDNQNKLAHIPYTKEKIKSVVTKEQYEQNSFKL